MMTAEHLITTSRTSAGALAARSAIDAEASDSVLPAMVRLSMSRSGGTWFGSMGAASSTLRCSTRPVSVMITSSRRTSANCTTSQCRTRDDCSVGNWTTAT